MKADWSSEVPELQLKINHYELVFVIEAMHSAIMRRLYVAVAEEHGDLRSISPVSAIQRALGTLTTLYYRAWGIYEGERSPDDQQPWDTEWEEMHQLPDAVWDLITLVMGASKWDEVPTHEIGHSPQDCVVCRYMYMAQLGGA